MSCLEDQTVAAFARGALAPEDMVAANAHARACPVCHGKLVHALQLTLTQGTVDSPLSPPIRPTRPDDLLAAGTTVGRYTVLAAVGRGGMGQVYSAYDPKLDRRVALKLIHVEHSERDSRAQDRLLREAQSIARLSHPNVVVVHDVGSHGDRVFVAMEFVDGTTLASWAKERPRTWREILRLYLQAGRGLAAAHRAGLVHRDFKPQNVMVSRHGDVRVMDFGLARQIGGALHPDPSRPPPPADTHDLSLTRPGEQLGTPRYMAPEQFRGEAVDERSDQFSFCVALYEALFGAHPFDDDTYFSLSLTVSEGDLRPPSKERDVPGWLRRAVVRGLSSRPGDRYASMTALVAALEADPAVGRRRRLVALSLVGITAASLFAAHRTVARRREEFDLRVETAVGEATEALRAAHAQASTARALRADAFAAFDARDDARAEELWRRARAEGPKADAFFVAAEQAFETALLLDGARTSVRERRAAARLEHLALAEELGLEERGRTLSKAVEQDDQGALRAPGTIALRVHPAAVAIALERYERDPVTTRRTARPVAAIPRGESTLAPGSYRLVLDGPGAVRVFAPFEIQRGRRVSVDVDVPEASEVPAGFAYVPAGELWYGERDERLRTDFLRSVPLHRRRTAAFLIARHETTFREWTTFLSALPRDQRAQYLPSASNVLQGSVEVREIAGGWALTITPSAKRYEARSGELLTYEGRHVLKRQDWLDFPVSAVQPIAVERYLRWLDQTGRVRRARLCTEVEWERAARGADDRVYPHGDTLEPNDANFDDTYARVLTALGPDVVGSHPGSRSPFGVDDLAGNIWEFVSASDGQGELAIRGGGYYFTAASSRITNREPVPRTYAGVVVGLRVCASPPSR